jgi:hypothetical protein
MELFKTIFQTNHGQTLAYRTSLTALLHLLPGVAKQPNLELKTQPKQLLGSLPLVIALPELTKS